MQKLFWNAVALALLVAVSPAQAFTLKSANDPKAPCAKDGSGCNVFCDNGDLAGVMYWNETNGVWTDGIKSDPDRDVEARKICAANGSACT